MFLSEFYHKNDSLIQTIFESWNVRIWEKVRLNLNLSLSVRQNFFKWTYWHMNVLPFNVSFWNRDLKALLLIARVWHRAGQLQCSEICRWMTYWLDGCMSRWTDGWVNHSQWWSLRIQGESSKPSTCFQGTCHLMGDIRAIEFPGVRRLETWLLYAWYGRWGGLPGGRRSVQEASRI